MLSIILSVLLIYFSLQFRINFIYIALYILFIIITYMLIKETSEVYSKKEQLDKRDIKREFIKFIIIYMIIIVSYIILFSFLFFLTAKLNIGQIISNDGIKPVENFRDFLFFSGITFVSYDAGFFPTQLMKIFVFIELFLSQIIILGFLFIIFGHLMEEIKEKL